METGREIIVITYDSCDAGSRIICATTSSEQALAIIEADLRKNDHSGEYYLGEAEIIAGQRATYIPVLQRDYEDSDGGEGYILTTTHIEE